MRERIRKSDGEPAYAIRIIRKDGVEGWLLDNEASVRLFDTPEAAEKHIKQLAKNSRYLWNETVEVCEFSASGR